MEVKIVALFSQESTYSSIEAFTSTADAEDEDTEDEETSISLFNVVILTNFSATDAKRKHDQIAKLKADLEASIRILKKQSSKMTLRITRL